MISSFVRERSGNFAVAMALVMVPICFSVGLAVDYSRALSARSQLQSIADMTALAMAASKESDTSKLEAIGLNFIVANYNGRMMNEISVANIESSGGKIDLLLESTVPTTFMQLARIEKVDIAAQAVAERGSGGPVEIALVLDNTFSMSETDSTGKKKLQALKQAAAALVNNVMNDSKGNAKISIVPYADYVTLNPATTSRNASWLDVPADYTPPDWCDEWIYVDICKRYNPTPCTRYQDGNPYQSDECGCAEWGERTQTPRVPPVCHPQPRQVWWGCVGSRLTKAAREDDILPEHKYPGLLHTSRQCPTPIQALTTNREVVLNAINQMDNVYYSPEGWISRKPDTYLPAGLTWGLNVLTPQAPFTETTVASNQAKPRQVLILMTDGENTMALNEWENAGRVYNFEWFAHVQHWPEWKAKTDGTTRSLCENIKNNHNIEIYSVAFMVRNDPDSKRLMEDCSTDKKTHYFDARDSSDLLNAFQAIGSNLSVVRLTK